MNAPVHVYIRGNFWPRENSFKIFLGSVPFFVNPDRSAIITRLGVDPKDASERFDVGTHVENAYVNAWPRDSTGVG